MAQTFHYAGGKFLISIVLIFKIEKDYEILTENPADALKTLCVNILEKYSMKKIFSKSQRYFEGRAEGLPNGLIMTSDDGKMEVIDQNQVIFAGDTKSDALFCFISWSKITNVDLKTKTLKELSN